MLKISYASRTGLCQVILMQYTVEICITA